jgi:hypothetical protein
MSTFDPLGDMFSSMSKLYTEQRELAAIWLHKPLVTGEGRTVRIAPEATVCVVEGVLTDCTPELPPTHKVLACFGTLTSQFEMTLIDLKTNEPLQYKL